MRIEDTDQSRRVQDAEERLIKDLEWAGLSWDEGPDRGGPYGPYRQSERLALYHQHAQTLIDKDEAYRCFCSSEQLEAEKRSLHVSGLPTAYSGTCRLIDKSESSRRADMGEAHVVRFKGGERARPQFKDAIYGIIQKKDPEEDFVLLKSDGYPTYHLANVVDDYCMKITHVIRGEEWLISTPKHVALYHAFGWQPPTFAHLGLLVNPDGTKLSKRDNSANLSTYQEEQGIFPLALLSWLANLGSSFKSQKGPMPRTISQVADALTFKFTRGGIKLNFAKLHYFHNKYAHDLLYRPIPELAETETGLLHRHLVQPLLREIDAMGGRNSPDLTGLPAAWQTELELVPSLQSDESSRAAHVRRVLNTMRNNFDSPRSVLNKDPYLFWRVPTSLYRRSLAAFAPDRRVLDALDEATTGSRAATNWGGPDAKPVDLVRDALSSRDVHVDESSLHNVLRLVGAGAHDAASQSSHNMMIVLGRNEWRHRLDRLNDVLVEMLSS
ncbi:hypothetical protein CDD83_212 [Cordyceps sp. RAO-2017]|nr:hypothetical protein CDD83_212 [Cordyceps sp. RAO-2017]